MTFFRIMTIICLFGLACGIFSLVEEPAVGWGVYVDCVSIPINFFGVLWFGFRWFDT